MLLRIILGVIGITIGFLVVWKSEWILENFGANTWAENNLGTSGGSRLLYKFIGIVAIFFSLLYMTGMIQGFLMATVGRLFMLK
jgi:hypothetical protein